ncbi:cyclic peptide export ABC transporter [Rhodococcus sp. P1Y]|uniref:cyclic peptide export ABC transporter n=1 Tax=Rhodococcus sp. P1Y TaxID=1302308 RepID=UPI000EAEE253|nr:cyclic peptide export ABC transporter [Rhodococcus sp. P1Y]AYJ50568.1 cyclic peptide export ABC transporter [Rhodococcus sp. P1Y]
MKNLLAVLLRGGRGISVLAVVAGIVTGVATIAMVATITTAVSTDSGLGALPLFIGAAVLVLLSGALASNALVRVTQRSVDRLRTKLVDDLLAIPLRRFEAFRTSRATAVLTEDLAAVGQAVQSLPLLLINSVIVICALAYVGILSPIALLVLVAVIVVGGSAYAFANGKAGVHMTRARQAQDGLHDSYQAITHGFKDVKLSARLRRSLVDDDLRTHSARYADSVVKGSTVSLVTGYWGQMLFLACVGAVAFGGDALGIPAQDRIGVALAVLYLNTPLVTVLNIGPVLSRAVVALRRIEEVATLREATETAQVNDRPSVVDEIGVDAVRFAYATDNPGESFAIGPVSQRFTRGSITFLVGGNGSGKSTLGRILAGLYTPDGGAVTVDGIPLSPELTVAYRENVSACFADSYVFGRLRSDEPEVLSRARYWLTELGLDDVVELDGDRLLFDGLSSGQRKRLALVETLADPRDVVVLDEWAAEQDPENRHRFYTDILPRIRDEGRIVIVVTHDDRYFDLCDRLVKLERGAQVLTELPAHH